MGVRWVRPRSLTRYTAGVGSLTRLVRNQVMLAVARKRIFLSYIIVLGAADSVFFAVRH